MARPKKRKLSALDRLARDEKRSKKRRRRPKQNKLAESVPDSEEDHSPYPVGPLEEASRFVTSPDTTEPPLGGLVSEMVAGTDESQSMEHLQDKLLKEAESLADATAGPDQTEFAPPVDPALGLT